MATAPFAATDGRSSASSSSSPPPGASPLAVGGGGGRKSVRPAPPPRRRRASMLDSPPAPSDPPPPSSSAAAARRAVSGKSPASSSSSSAAAAATPRRKRRARPGVVALREIRRFQKSTELLLRRLPFGRVVRDLCVAVNRDPERPIRWQAEALAALQQATEAYLVGLFEDANLCAIHGRRVTMMVKDLR